MQKLVYFLILSLPFIPISSVRTTVGLAIFFVVVVGLLTNQLTYFDSLLVIISIEMLLKITESLIISEFSKYACMLISIIYFLRSGQKSKSLFILIPFTLLLISINYFDGVKAQLQFVVPWITILIILASKNFFTSILATKIFRYGSFSLVAAVFIYGGNFDTVGSGQWSNNAAIGFSANQFTNYVGAWLLGFILFTEVRHKPKAVDILLMGGLVVISFISLSRGGMISLLVAVLFLLRRRRVIHAFIYFGTIALILFLFLPENIQTALELRYTGKSKNSTLVLSDLTSGRESLNSRDLKLFYNNPLFGIGVNKTRNYYRDVSSHSEWIRLLAEHGMFGTLPLIVTIVILLNVSYKFSDKRQFWSAVIFVLLSYHQGSNRNVAQVLPVIVVLANVELFRIKGSRDNSGKQIAKA